jgi:hypothetical protein
MPRIPNVWDVAPVRTYLCMISAPCAQVLKGSVSRGGAEERGDKTRRPADRIRRVEEFRVFSPNTTRFKDPRAGDSRAILTPKALNSDWRQLEFPAVPCVAMASVLAPWWRLARTVGKVTLSHDPVEVKAVLRE